MAEVREDNWFHRMMRGEESSPPVAKLLGECITDVDEAAGEMRNSFTASPDFRNPGGTVQGGMLAAMLDALTAGLVDATVASGEIVATLNLSVHYLAPALPGSIEGRGRIVRRGRDICFVHGELWQGGKQVAGAEAVCKIVKARP